MGIYLCVFLISDLKQYKPSGPSEVPKQRHSTHSINIPESTYFDWNTLCTVNNDIMTNVSFDSEQMELHLQRL